MQKTFVPKTDYELFAQKVYDVLVENFPKTYFTGGSVRDYISDKQITDFDLATEATPEIVAELLHKHNIKSDNAAANFGIIKALHNGFDVEVATFRTDKYHDSRYPEVVWNMNAESDSVRRDFTVNALYFQPKTGELLDFHNGLHDLQNRIIRFIGDPQKRVEEDPLRIIRAYRFEEVIDGKMDEATLATCENNFDLLHKISKTKLQSEIDKCSQQLQFKLREKLSGNT